MSKLRPTSITLDNEKHELRIEWPDDHTSVYPLNQLREACPCAFCRGGHDKMGREHDPVLLEIAPVKHYQVEHIQKAGKYALQIWWDDGHNAGIYSWEYLRKLAPPPGED
ncbi:MAG: DUF971 domain-containing protein [Chloroflexi bacterium]|nr:DUF971 domain-containing protein [Chloroflexota bacterium]